MCTEMLPGSTLRHAEKPPADPHRTQHSPAESICYSETDRRFRCLEGSESKSPVVVCRLPWWTGLDLGWSAMKLVMACLVLAVAAAGCGSESSAEDASTTGRACVVEFLELLGEDGAPGLDDFLADGFQLQRADGTGATRDEYVANPAVVNSFTIADGLIAVQDGDVITVRWSVVVDETISGEQYGTELAPRLSVCVRDGGRWKLMAHANFNRAG